MKYFPHDPLCVERQIRYYIHLAQQTHDNDKGKYSLLIHYYTQALLLAKGDQKQQNFVRTALRKILVDHQCTLLQQKSEAILEDILSGIAHENSFHPLLALVKVVEQSDFEAKKVLNVIAEALNRRRVPENLEAFKAEALFTIEQQIALPSLQPEQDSFIEFLQRQLKTYREEFKRE